MSVTADQVHGVVQTLTQSSDTLFLLLGAIMVFLMHAGFAFLEVGTVRQKNQVNALVKIIADFGISAIAYFLLVIGLLMAARSFLMLKPYLKIMATSWLSSFSY